MFTFDRDKRILFQQMGRIGEPRNGKKNRVEAPHHKAAASATPHFPTAPAQTMTNTGDYTTELRSPRHRAAQDTGKVWDTPSSIQRLAGVNEINNQTGTPEFYDQMPGHLAANNMVWMAAWDTDATGKADTLRYYLAPIHQLEEGTVVIVPGRGPQVVRRDDETNVNRLMEMPTRPRPGEVIVAGIEPSRRVVKVREQHIGEDGGVYYETRDVHLVPGFYSTSVTDGSTKILKDKDRATFYDKNRYGQYRNKNGMLLLIDKQGKIHTDIQDYRGVYSHHMDVRRYAQEDTPIMDKAGNPVMKDSKPWVVKKGDALPTEYWKFYIKKANVDYEAKGATKAGVREGYTKGNPHEEGQLVELMDEKGNRIIPKIYNIKRKMKDGVEHLTFSIAKNNHGHMLDENGKIVCINSKGQAFTVDNNDIQDPTARLDYDADAKLRPIAFRRVEHFENEKHIEKYGEEKFKMERYSWLGQREKLIWPFLGDRERIEISEIGIRIGKKKTEISLEADETIRKAYFKQLEELQELQVANVSKYVNQLKKSVFGEDVVTLKDIDNHLDALRKKTETADRNNEIAKIEKIKRITQLEKKAEEAAQKIEKVKELNDELKSRTDKINNERDEKKKNELSRQKIAFLHNHELGLLGSPMAKVRFLLDYSLPGQKYKPDGSPIDRLIDEDSPEAPRILKEGVWIKDAMTIEDPRDVWVNHNARRGFKSNNQMSRNTKDRLVFKNELLTGPEWDKYLVRNQDTGRVTHYKNPNNPSQKFAPGYIIDENGDNVLLAEEPDYAYGGNNRVLRKYYLDADNRPIITWDRLGNGEQLDAIRGMDWHPMNHVQLPGGAQNSGGSNRWMVRNFYGYQIHENSWRAAENNNHYIRNKDGSSMMDMAKVPSSEANPFFRDDLYKYVTPVTIRNQRVFEKFDDDFSTARHIYSLGVGSTIRYDATRRIQLGILETLGFLAGTDNWCIMEGMGFHAMTDYKNQPLKHNSIFQTVYMAPIGGALGAASCLMLGTSLATAGLGFAIGGLALSAIAAPLYYHYIYDQSDRRKNTVSQEIIDKNVKTKYIWEGKEDHSQFLIGLRNDLYHAFWDGMGVQTFFHDGGVDGRKRLNNASYENIAKASGAGALSLGVLAYGVTQASVLTSSALATVGTGGAAFALAAVYFAGMAAYNTARYRLNKHAEVDVFVNAYSNDSVVLDRYIENSDEKDRIRARIDKEYRTKDGFCTTGMDYVREALKGYLALKMQDGNDPVNQRTMDGYIKNKFDTAFRAR